jgi:hypothetical protein
LQNIGLPRRPVDFHKEIHSSVEISGGDRVAGGARKRC